VSLFSDVAGIFTAGRSAKAISDANIAAEQGVLNQTAAGQTNILGAANSTGVNVGNALNSTNDIVNSTLRDATTNVNQAGTNINTAAGTANNTLAGVYNQIRSDTQPSIDSGAQGNRSLQAYAASNPQFSFNYNDYANDPAFQFQMDQGTRAIQNQAASQGLAQGGNTLQALTQYGQGLASTYYNDAFNRAQTQFQTNQNTTLANLQALINSGAQGNSNFSQAGEYLGGQIANNTTGAATQNATLQQYLAGLNTTGQQNLGQLNVSGLLGAGAQSLQGSEAAGQLGLAGATTAGNFATGAGNARASGIIGQGAAVGGLVSDLGGLITNPALGIFPSHP